MTTTTINDYAVRTQGLAKRFGAFEAVSDLNLNVPKGSIYGFLGMNGAGKTTTLKMLSGLSKPSAGEIFIDGEKLTFGNDKVSPARYKVGFLPDVPSFYGWMNAYEFLKFSGELYGISKSVLPVRIDELLSTVGLKGCKKRISGYSRGMKQRLGIAQAMINNPSILLLDEPVSALDPLGRKEVMDVIYSLAGKVTVFFSTHILADVERVCDKIMILHRGKMVMETSMAELGAEEAGTILIKVGNLNPDVMTNSTGSALDLIKNLDFVDSCTNETGILKVITRNKDKANLIIPGVLSNAEIPIISYTQNKVSLEDVFMEVVSK